MVKRLNINKKRFWAGVLLAQFLLFYTLSKIGFAVSLFEKFFEFQKETQTKIFSKFPFSIGDIIYVSLILYLVFKIVQIFNKNKRNKAILKILIVLNIFYFFYQIFWGMLYFKTPIQQKLGEYEPTTNDLKKLSIVYLEKAINTRKLVEENNDGTFKITNFSAIEKEILLQQQFLPLDLIDKRAIKVISIKESLFGQSMNYSGILGYFNPFTAEAQYNANLPQTYIPFTTAHESAHQLGYAKEQEANFLAYLIGKNSKNIELQHSTNYYVLRSLLNALHEREPAFVEQMLNQYSDGMKRDRKSELIFRKQHEGLVDDFFGFTNDLFLKTNQQEGSVTYSYFIQLLSQYELKK